MTQPDTVPEKNLTSVKTEESVTMQLADYTSNLSYDSLPQKVVNKVKQLLLDGLSNQIAASVVAEPARIVIELLGEFGGSKDATVTGYGYKLPTPHAAMANAMLGHGVELDDAHGNALTKSGSVIIPTILAVGEKYQKHGKDLIAAMVAAYDVMIRIGLSINPSHRKRGFHTTGTAGAFAAAAGAARLLDLNQERTAWALGLAGMQSAGLQAFLSDPCMAKPFSPGKAAFNGVLAALLAARGLTGPRFILEGKEGFFEGYADQVDVPQLTTGLGEDFKINQVAFKPHAACRYAHGPIDAMQALVEEHDLKASQITSITVRCCELAIRQSGRVEVPNLNSAMGSTPYGLAVAVTQKDNGLKAYMEAFKNPVNQEIARKVRMVQDPAYGTMGRAATVEVQLTDGRMLSHYVPGPKGEPQIPLSEEELESKYLSLATMAIDQGKAEKIVEQISGLEICENVAVIPPMTKWRT